MSDHLKDSINQFYKEKQLSPSQLSQLADRGKNPWSYPWKPLPIAFASILIALAFFVFSPSPEVHQLVIEEIAYNHRKNLAIEVKTDSIKVVQSTLNKLDFTLIQSSFADMERYKIIGARYCSIQGKLAAQIKGEDKITGKRITLYQSPIPIALKSSSFKEFSGFDQGTRVKFWQEKGIFFGLAIDE